VSVDPMSEIISTLSGKQSIDDMKKKEKTILLIKSLTSYLTSLKSSLI
jgi:hypothetical protein